MSSENVLLFGSNTPVRQADDANTAGAIVKRDPNGNIFGTGLAAGTAPSAAPSGSAYRSNVGSEFQGFATQNGTNTLNNASAAFQKLNAAGGAFTTTLPPASTSANQWFMFVKSDATANVPTLKGSGTDNIITSAGVTANTYAGLTGQGNSIKLWCDGTQWWQVP